MNPASTSKRITTTPLAIDVPSPAQPRHLGRWAPNDWSMCRGSRGKAVISHLAMDQKPGSLVNIKLYVCIYGNDI